MSMCRVMLANVAERRFSPAALRMHGKCRTLGVLMRYSCHVALALTATLVSTGVATAQSRSSADGLAFHGKVAALYSFEPHKLTSAEIEAKSKVLDGFWEEVKADPNRYLPLLREELRDGRNSAFFSYDGSKLLLTISKERNDQALALEAIPRADLHGVQHTDYLRTVHWFARNGFDTTTAALRVLDYPDFKAFIVEHALTLGQNYSLIYMLFPMPDDKYVAPLIDRLNTEENLVSQKSILLALWYAMTPEAKAAAARFIADTSKSQDARQYAKELSERKAPLTSSLTLSTASQLKAERRKVVYRLSDEALYEFDSLTVKLLAKQ